MHQIYFNNVSTNFIVGEPFEAGTFGNDSRVAEVLGIPQLKEETSENLSAGLVFNVKKFNLSADAYSISVKDRVVLTGNFSGVDPRGDVDNDGVFNQNDGDSPGGTAKDYEIFSLLSSVGASTARFFSNAVDTETSGIDIVAGYSNHIGEVELEFIASANFSITKIVGDIKTTPLLSEKKDVYFDRREIGRLEDLVPNSKVNLTLQASYHNLGFMIHAVRFGEVVSKSLSTHTLSGNEFYDNEYKDERFSSKVVTDVSISYQMSDMITWSLGANNVFNTLPDALYRNADNDGLTFDRRDNTNRGRFLLPPVQQGMGGAYYFARLVVEI